MVMMTMQCMQTHQTLHRTMGRMKAVSTKVPVVWVLGAEGVVLTLVVVVVAVAEAGVEAGAAHPPLLLLLLIVAVGVAGVVAVVEAVGVVTVSIPPHCQLWRVHMLLAVVVAKAGGFASVLRLSLRCA